MVLARNIDGLGENTPIGRLRVSGVTDGIADEDLDSGPTSIAFQYIGCFGTLYTEHYAKARNVPCAKNTCSPLSLSCHSRYSINPMSIPFPICQTVAVFRTNTLCDYLRYLKSLSHIKRGFVLTQMFMQRVAPPKVKRQRM